MARKKTKKARPLIQGYLEQVSSKIFSDYPRQLTDLVQRQHGVYALYKGSRLYYVGLASNLRGRIKRHLRDKHSGKWDKFSLYLVRKADHIKELESIVMRVANPAGNAARGRLPRAENLKDDLSARIRQEQQQQVLVLLGGRRRIGGTSAMPRKAKVVPSARKPPLAPYVHSRFRIRGKYKGRVFTASVNKNGTIRYAGKTYNSPSQAGRAARGRTTNGWIFWTYKNRRGTWVRLDQLRK